MKKSLLLLLPFWLATLSTPLRAQPYGLDRLEFNEGYLNRKLPSVADLAYKGPVPLLLSQIGAFENVATLTPSRAMVPYTVNSPLWSDNADKTRWLFIPKDGKIGFTPNEWTFPKGSVFVKHFDLVINQVTGTSRRLETRILVMDANGSAYGYTYKWRADNSDAELVTAADGVDEPITITTAGGPVPFSWHYPSRSQCLTCHKKVANFVLGLKTAQLNGSFLYPATLTPTHAAVTDNQLRALNHIGIFDPPINEASIPTLPQMGYLTDESFTVENRVRSYLDANCSTCHRPKGGGPGFDGRFLTPLAGQRLVDQGSDKILFHNLDKSEVLSRDADLNGLEMPPLGKSINDPKWLALLSRWITNAFNPTNVFSSATRDKITVVFSDKPQVASATTIANYALAKEDNSQTYTLSNPVSDPATRSVTFNVAPLLTANVECQLTVNNILDQSTPPNQVWPNFQRKFKAPAGPLVPGPDNGLPPPNDAFANAATLSGSDASDSGFTCNASREPGEPGHAGNAGGASIWWKWTAPADGLVSVDTFNSDFDTLLGVYTGPSVSSLTPVASNDDFKDAPETASSDLLASRVTFIATTGQAYFIAVDGYDADCGNVLLHLHQGPGPVAPANDNFANASLLTGVSGTVAGDNHFATKEPGEPEHASDYGGASLWWNWTAPSDGTASFDTHGSTFDTTLAIYTGPDVAHLIFVSANDDDLASGTNTSATAFAVAGGVTYRIAVDGYGGDLGSVALNYSFVASPAILLPTLQATPLLSFTPGNGGDFKLRIDGPAGALVEVQVSDDLVTWKTISSATLGGQVLYVPATLSLATPQLFYRVLRHLE